MAEKNAKPETIDDVVFLGRAVERLSMLIDDQSKVIFDRKGIVIPVRSCSLMTVLSNLKAGTAADVARELGHSHQLVMQKIPKLIRLGLIKEETDRNDARRRLFRLTDEGAHQLEMFRQCRAAIRSAYEALFDEVGDVMTIVVRATNALKEHPLEKRTDVSG